MTMATRTVSKGRKKLVDAIFAGATGCVRYDLDSGFQGRPCDPESARKALAMFPRFSKLYSNGDGKYTVHVHSNLWYEVTSTARA
jgi:hypothetical protein